jgi:hypothetical protein
LAASDAQRDGQADAVVRFVGHRAQHDPSGASQAEFDELVPGPGAVDRLLRMAEPTL